MLGTTYARMTVLKRRSGNQYLYGDGTMEIIHREYNFYRDVCRAIFYFLILTLTKINLKKTHKSEIIK